MKSLSWILKSLRTEFDHLVEKTIYLNLKLKIWLTATTASKKKDQTHGAVNKYRDNLVILTSGLSFVTVIFLISFFLFLYCLHLILIFANVTGFYTND